MPSAVEMSPLSSSAPSVSPLSGPAPPCLRRSARDDAGEAPVRFKRKLSGGAESDVFACVARGRRMALKVFKDRHTMERELGILRLVQDKHLFPRVRPDSANTPEWPVRQAPQPRLACTA